MAISVLFRIMDAKGETSTFTIPVASTVTLANLPAYVQAVADLLEPLSNGTLVEAGFTVPVPITPLALAAPISDVQEKARFVFLTVGGFLKSLSIPSVVESIFSPGSRDVNTADPAVAALVTALTDGLTINTENIEAVDVRDEDLVNLIQATEAWGRSRG